jgi:HPt (histidine-containing phosphotransfer) domain-containing protein
MTDPANAPLFDLDQVAALREALGHDDFLDMYADLPDALGEHIQTITTAFADSNLPKIRAAAHALKGAASSFGACGVASAARATELNTPTLADAAMRIETLSTVFAQTLASIGSLTQGDQPSS